MLSRCWRLRHCEHLLNLPNNCLCNISRTAQRRVKRTSPSFSASKTEWETITKTSVLQSSKNRKIRGNWENHTFFSLFDFFSFFGGSRSLGMNTLNTSFSRVFEGAMRHFNLNLDIKNFPCQEICSIVVYAISQHRLSTEWKQSLKRLLYKVAKIGKSGETKKAIHLSPFLIFFYFSAVPVVWG